MYRQMPENSHIFHFIYSRHSLNVTNALIMNRIFYHRLFEKMFHCIGYSENYLLLNKHALVLDQASVEDVKDLSKIRTNGLGFKENELPAIIKETFTYPPLPPGTINDPLKKITPEMCKPFQREIVEKWNNCDNRCYILNDEIFERIITSAHKALVRASASNLIEKSLTLSNSMKIGMRDINTTSSTMFSSQLLSLFFFRHGVFLCSSTFERSVPPVAISIPRMLSLNGITTLKIATDEDDDECESETNFFLKFPDIMKRVVETRNLPITEHLCMDMKVFSKMNGGWWYGQLGVFRPEPELYTSLDFSSFYPSIISSFHLDFSNYCLMTGTELISVFYKMCFSSTTNLSLVGSDEVVDQLFFVLDLSCKPPNCSVVPFSKVNLMVNENAVYAVIYTGMRHVTQIYPRVSFCQHIYIHIY